MDRGPDQLEMNRRLIALSENPNVRFWRIDPAELSRSERTFLAIWELESQVNNGGFFQFFSNTSGAVVPYVVDARDAVALFTGL